MIEVVEAREVERRVMRVLCEYCGKGSNMVVIRMMAGDQEQFQAQLPICCEETRRRVSEGSTGGN